MNSPEDEKLREAGWRRSLTPEEEARLQAWLALHPAARQDWEVEAELNRCLQRLPDAPMASNFTAQVLSALDREDRQAAASTPPWRRFGRGLLRRLWSPGPRIAWALLVVAAAGLGYHQHQVSVRHEMASGFCALAKLTTLSGPGLLQDFEAIQRLSESAPDDDEELFVTLNQ